MTLLRDVEVDGRRCDVRVSQGRVVAMGARLSADREDVVDGHGGALLPGLHDHHLHLLAMAAALHSVHLGPPAVSDPGSFDRVVRDAAAVGSWLRGVSYDEATAGPLDRWRLDALAGSVPARVQHRSGALWVLNSAALAVTGLESVAADGRLFRQDELLRRRLPHEPPSLAEVGARLLRHGVTGVTDATPDADQSYVDTIAAGDLPQRVQVMSGPLVAVPPELTAGPVKLRCEDDTDLVELVEGIRAARHVDRCVAVHCVTRAALALALAAWGIVGVRHGDRVEHASVASPDAVAEIARLGLVVVTQPNFVAERGDGYLAAVDAGDLPHLYPCARLLDAGVPLAAGTDAPFGDADPWRAIAAAIDRRTASGRVLGADQRLAARAALDLFVAPLDEPGGSRRRVRTGVPADLCLLSVPLRDALAEPSASHVTWVHTASRELPRGFDGIEDVNPLMILAGRSCD